jgi:hypothetical protein
VGEREDRWEAERARHVPAACPSPRGGGPPDPPPKPCDALRPEDYIFGTATGTAALDHRHIGTAFRLAVTRAELPGSAGDSPHTRCGTATPPHSSAKDSTSCSCHGQLGHANPTSPSASTPTCSSTPTTSPPPAKPSKPVTAPSHRPRCGRGQDPRGQPGRDPPTRQTRQVAVASQLSPLGPRQRRTGPAKNLAGPNSLRRSVSAHHVYRVVCCWPSRQPSSRSASDRLSRTQRRLAGAEAEMLVPELRL